MAKQTFKIQKRQSGKTYKLIGKFLKYQSEGKHPLLFSYNNAKVESIKDVLRHYINDVSTVYSRASWKSSITLLTDVILIDDFLQWSKEDLEEIRMISRKQNIKIYALSSMSGE